MFNIYQTRSYIVSLTAIYKSMNLQENKIKVDEYFSSHTGEEKENSIA